MTNKELYTQFAEEMTEALGSHDGRVAVANKIVKYVSDSIDQYDVGSLMLPKETIPIGTTAEYVVRGKLKAYWHEPGSYAPRTAMTQKIFTVPTWMISAHPEYEISQLEAGRYGTAQDQIVEAREAILGAINARIFTTVSGSVVSTDINYFTVAGALNATALNRAINYVEDQVGGVSAIVGRRNLLYPLLDINTTGAAETGILGDPTKELIFKTGKMQAYRGIPLIGLPQWRDGFGKLTIAQDEILVIGNQAGRYVVNQELRSQQEIDVDTLMWHVHLYMKMGVAVFFSKRIAKIKVLASV